MLYIQIQFQADLLFEETLQRARLPSDFTTATEDDAFKLASQNRLGSSQLNRLRNMQSNLWWVKLGLWQILICMNKVAFKLDKFHDFIPNLQKKNIKPTRLEGSSIQFTHKSRISKKFPQFRLHHLLDSSLFSETEKPWETCNEVISGWDSKNMFHANPHFLHF